MLKNLHNVDLGLLRLFVTVCESGGFSAAQAQLNLTQSTISTQMAKLETRLGFRLCERGRSGFKLTERGQAVLSASYELFDAIESFCEQAQNTQQQITGTLRIGVTDNLITHPQLKLSQALAQLKKQAPELIIELIINDTENLNQQLINQQIHLAISEQSTEHNLLQFEPLFIEQQKLYCGKGHPLFAQAKPNKKNLANSQWVRYYHDPKPSTARAEHIEGIAYFILSGEYIGYLADHYAQTWVKQGLMYCLGEDNNAPTFSFGLMQYKKRRESQAMRAFKGVFLN